MGFVGKIRAGMRLISPVAHIRKKITSKLEKEIWGSVEKYGVDFLAISGHTDPKHNRYQITRPQHLMFIAEYFDSIKDNVGTPSIIDIGCGKGGMLYFFFGLGLKKVAGLEYSNELCMICKKNMQKLNIDANIICGDAAEYDKYEVYDYFYLYNPFGEEVVKSFVENLIKNQKEHERTIHVIYTYPVHMDIFLDMGFEVEKQFKTSFLFKEPAYVLVRRC